VVYAVHDEQIATHGGLAGLRDETLLLSALARPQHLEADGNPDLDELAAAYAIGIARNHPFLDGNQRMATIIAAGLFLPLNGYELIAANEERVMPEAELAAWFRTYVRAVS
jgi:death-on-curing protein